MELDPTARLFGADEALAVVGPHTKTGNNLSRALVRPFHPAALERRASPGRVTSVRRRQQDDNLSGA